MDSTKFIWALEYEGTLSTVLLVAELVAPRGILAVCAPAYFAFVMSLASL